jgi:hypothetical protein
MASGMSNDYQTRITMLNTEFAARQAVVLTGDGRLREDEGSHCFDMALALSDVRFWGQSGHDADMR